MSEYSKKLLWKDGQEITVHSEQEEAEKRADGFLGHGETASEQPRGAADGEQGDEPTFGPSHDDTHAKRTHKKK